MKERTVFHMCMECRQYPCHPRCPNAPEPAEVYTCAHCGEPIREGDEYFEYNGNYYHEECFGDAAPAIVAEDGATKVEAKSNSRKLVGKCAHCEEEVFEDEDHWKYDGKLYHHECLLDCAQILLEDETSHGTAEAEEYVPEYDPADKYDW